MNFSNTVDKKKTMHFLYKSYSETYNYSLIFPNIIHSIYQSSQTHIYLQFGKASTNKNKVQTQWKKWKDIWFNAPFNITVITKVTKKLLALIDKYFLKNKNIEKKTSTGIATKENYSCLPHIKLKSLRATAAGYDCTERGNQLEKMRCEIFGRATSAHLTAKASPNVSFWPKIY